MSEQSNSEITGSVAIIGMAGRFPGAPNVEAFWQNVSQGVESIRAFTPKELLEAGVSPEFAANPNYVNAKGFLPDALMFDAAFFGINSREAEVTDPQQRIFLECAWEALESAGYVPDNAGAVGIFGGSALNTYFIANIMGNQALIDAVGAYQIMLGSDKDFLTTRVSYKLNLKGPSVVVQTACSTSLVAVQSAYQALLNYQCDMALAGGVSITFPQTTGYLYQTGMILSPDGHCRAFDSKAKGTVEGEGVGIVVLKRLEDAIQAGDNILAVIRGAAINNDGSQKIGFTAPGIEGQTEVIAMAQAVAGIEPETVSYIEAHGTGTPLGDPIEIAALTRAFQMGTSQTGFCAIGSVKTNIGHLNAAAGVAGLIRTVLALQHRKIPPSLHFQRPNPEIDFDQSPFYVNNSLEDWKSGDTPRRAGISSFGMGGTNAHVVLEEAPAIDKAPSRRRNQVLVLSARSSEALEAATQNLANVLANQPELDLAGTAYTLQTGRKHFQHRRVLVSADQAEASQLLSRRDSRRVFTAQTASEKKSENRPIVFLLTGQGSQSVGMLCELYDNEPVFRRHLDYCCDRLKTSLRLDLRTVLYPEAAKVAEAEGLLQQTRLAQPAIFSVDYALAKLWMHWGVQPAALLGHSLGEYVAACLAGVFSLDDALDLVAERGRLMQSVPRGAMLSVPLGRDALGQLEAGLSLATVNSPDLSVVSGPFDAIERCADALKKKGIESQRLRTSHAFHSSMMDSILEPFVARMAAITLRPPDLPIQSNLTGTWLTPEQATDPAYWGRHLRYAVLFSDSVSELLKDQDYAFLEVGPGRTLTSLVRRLLPKGHTRDLLSSLPHPDDQVSDSQSVLTVLGRLWAAGVEVDWQAFQDGEPNRRVALPTYPFERRRFCAERPKLSKAAASTVSGKTQDVGKWFYVPSWRRTAPPSLPRLNKAETAKAEAAKERWLLYLDDRGVGAALAEALIAGGSDVVLVRPGRSFAREAEGSYVLYPGGRNHYEALVEDLVSRDRLPSHLVHLFTVTSGPESSDQSGSESLFNRGFYSLLYSVQAFVKVPSAKALFIDVISNQTQDVSGGEPVSAEKSAILGLSRVIGQEYGHLHCRNIDAALSENPVDPAFIAQLQAELTSSSSEPVVALRGGQRWVQHFEPVTIPKDAARTRLRENGVYLITGGLGAIGLLVARHIAGTTKARLVLTSRAGLPPRQQWDALSGDPSNQSLSEKITSIREIESLGSEVLVLAANVASQPEMQAVVDKIDAQFGSINGVIHAAGAVGPGDFADISDLHREGCERQFQAKVHGTHVLEHVLRGRPLDFCFLTSSLSALLGGLGFAAYASANAFLDGFAHERNREGKTPWIVVNWDGWLRGEVQPQSGPLALAMTPAEGIETFDRILGARELNHVVVSSGDLATRLREWTGTGRAEAESAVPAKVKTANVLEFEDAEAFLSKTEATLAPIWRDVLGLSQIGRDEDFFELGGHSLMATQLLSRVRDAMGIPLQVRQLFETRTIAAFAEIIDASLLREKLARKTEEEVGADREELTI
jgi:acyl transferase domain-containing protein